MDNMDHPGRQRKLAAWIELVCAAEKVEINEIKQLDGGAIQQNWLIRIRLYKGGQNKLQELVLRTDSAATIAESRSREEEFLIMQAAFNSGVTAPRPVGFCHDTDILGQVFSLVEKVDGIGFGPKVVKQTARSGNGDRIVTALAGQMSKIHQMDPENLGLTCIDTSGSNHASEEVSGLMHWLDQHAISRPVLEWGLRWARRHLPEQQEPVFVHRDFRTGNFLVNEEGLSAILDWEFSGYGDPMSDIGWFCAECWRFSRPDLAAGGLADRAVFYQAYESASGRQIQPASVYFWELVAHLRWAVIALQQGARHLSGAEPSLSMAITSRIVDQLELIVLRMTGQTNDQPIDKVHNRNFDKDARQQRNKAPQHQSTGNDLLAIARASMTDTVLPELSASSRLNALMVNNAIGIVEREIAFASAKAAAEEALLSRGRWTSHAELAAVIRKGALDDDVETWQQLTALAAIQSEIFKPGFANQEELAGMSAG